MGVSLITDFSYGAMLPFSVPGLKSVYSYLNGAGKYRNQNCALELSCQSCFWGRYYSEEVEAEI